MKSSIMSRRRALALAFLGAALLSASSRTHAQQPGVEQVNVQPTRVTLTVGRSTVVRTDFDVTRIAVTNPAVADATVVTPREVLIDGKGAGTVSLIVWGAGDRREHLDVVVDQATLALEQQLHLLFPGEDLQVSGSEDAIVLHGSVSSNEVSLRAAEIAAAAAPKAKIVNMLLLPGGNESQQVMLQVRVAEVNRRALTELGLNLFVSRSQFVARSTTQQFAAPNPDDTHTSGFTFSDYLNLFFFSRTEGIGGVLRALQQTGYFQTLAEPNLIAYNGQDASFLAGGEFPVPVVQGATGQVTIQFKEFGVKLDFTPRIAGDVIRLRVKPEVSSLDFNNGVTLSGFRIPALITRRADTDVELRDGQSFAIAGLLNNLAQVDASAIPVLSKLPVIGPLFKSKADRKEQTELMVLVTPRLVRALDPDEVPSLPTAAGDFLPSAGSKGEGTEGPAINSTTPGAVR